MYLVTMQKCTIILAGIAVKMFEKQLQTISVGCGTIPTLEMRNLRLKGVKGLTLGEA